MGKLVQRPLRRRLQVLDLVGPEPRILTFASKLRSKPQRSIVRDLFFQSDFYVVSILIADWILRRSQSISVR